MTMLLSDFIHIGAEFEVQEVGSFDSHTMLSLIHISEPTRPY